MNATRIVIATLFLAGLPTPARLLARTGEGDHLRPRSTYAVIVGILEWQGKSLSSFSKENRRDRALYDRLRAMGVPGDQMKLLLDAEATEEAMAEAIEAVARSAPEKSTFVFYYAGHGYPASRGICLANYDAGVNGNEGFFVDRVGTLLKRHFRGGRVLLFADCCFSGGLSDVAATLSKQGFACASLTAASATNESTHQWTFTCNLLDALQGRPLLDRDGDGYITLTEAGHAATEAMAFVERQRSDFSLHGLDGSLRLCEVDADAPAPKAGPGPFELRQFVRIGRAGRGKTARVVDFRDGKYAVEIQRYHDRKLIWQPAGKLSAMERPRLPKGHRKPPEALGTEAAREKAHVGGKYATLVRTVTARYDYLQYGAFHDYGFSKETAYAGEKDIPPGYWVYVYPDWYVFRDTSAPDRD